MVSYRKLTSEEIFVLKSQMCVANDWNDIEVAEDFSAMHVVDTRFSGKIRLGSFSKEFVLPGGMVKHSGLYHATLHNVTIGDDCCIENVKNYISNYEIGNDVFIENVDIILTDGESQFGNGVEVSVMSETGGREVLIYDRLSAQTAYMMALYRHRPELINRLKDMIHAYSRSVTSCVGHIGDHVTIADAGYIKNVCIHSWCKIEGAARLKNGTINSNASAPVHIGVGVIGDDFIISSGSRVEDGVHLTKCFVGQACVLGHNYSASDSLFFSNCRGENGEACAIFAGPYTVTHHKSTLLISGMFSFMNAGSGSNQSNHMYKLGPIHQGIMERGAKTASDSYLLWPARVGAFSLVMGRHVSHQDTSNFPFSYLIEQSSTTYIMPGANLKSVGTIRDARKWPGRDARTDPDKIDQINYNLLSPYTIQKMLNALEILDHLQKVSGETSEAYVYQSGKIKRSSMLKGIHYYQMAIDKFFGNSLISRLQKGVGGSSSPDGKKEGWSLEEVHDLLVPHTEYGCGDWIDMSGMIAPKAAVMDLIGEIESGKIHGMEEISSRFTRIHENYYDEEWTWAFDAMQRYYHVDLLQATAEDLIRLVEKWQESVIGLDQLIYDDARKEFSLSAMTSFGADGDERERNLDFEQVRGSFFESDPFVKSVKNHIAAKTQLGEEIIARLREVI